jgi:NAD(P)-dependent dehydrogenase (short-subunit alcohol dehydrogenase family)
MPTVLVTGASRGLGAEFVRQYARAGWDVIACSRKPSDLPGAAGNISQYPLEVTDFAAVKALADKLSGTSIDVLVNNAGISGPEAGTLGSVDADVWHRTFLINALAPLKIAEAFTEHVAASAQRKMVAITSRLGSIALNNEGGRYAYRASKAALNMHWKSLSCDLRGNGVICTVLHPGWVRTDMGGASAPVSPPESVAGMISVIDRLKAEDNGAFFNYDGTSLPW